MRTLFALLICFMEKGSYSTAAQLYIHSFFRLSYCMYILEQLRAMFPNHTLQIMYDTANYV